MCGRTHTPLVTRLQLVSEKPRAKILTFLPGLSETDGAKDRQP